MPDWRDPPNIQVLPSLRSPHDFDIFARWADSSKDFPGDARTPVRETYSPKEVLALMPYSSDLLKKEFGALRCGSPVCYRAKRLETWITHRNIFVLDLVAYNWTHTLKDPKSWAVVNVALENNIRHLAAWTAGNAGLSLAKIVRACNQYLDADKRIQVYALHDSFDKSVDTWVRGTLRNWECELIPVPSVKKQVFTPDEIEDKVRHLAIGLFGKYRSEEYWDVTDGWDSVGMLMYRLIIAQVVRDLRPTHIVAPLGTGNLILGILLGVKDCENVGAVEKNSLKVIGAMPSGENIIHKIAGSKITETRYADSLDKQSTPPLMPKIAVTYTPLLACIDDKVDKEQLYFAEADSHAQSEAATTLARAGKGRRILAEPSSISAFAVLPRVANKWLHRSTDERVLVINSGFGLLSELEHDFLSKPRV
jgi:hypothetical protein